MSRRCSPPTRAPARRRRWWSMLAPVLLALLQGVVHAADAGVAAPPGPAPVVPAPVPGTAPGPDDASGSTGTLLPPAGTGTPAPAAATPAVAECQPTPFASQSPSALLAERADFTPYAGMTIGAVQLDRISVFDESNRRENLRLYRLLNDLHILSRDATIRRQLLFTPGESLLPRRIEETERNLRQNSYIADARIVPLQVCGNTVDLRVVTRDTWSLEPGASYSHGGGTSASGFSLKDGNFLGTGDSLSVDFSHTSERDSVDYEVTLNSLFGRRITTTVHYVDTSDGRITSLETARPFYALDTPWSAGGSLYQEKRIDTDITGGTVVGRYQHDINKYEAFGGVSPGLRDNFSNRYLVGITREQDLFAEVDPAYPVVPEDRNLTYPWVAFETTENRFAVYHNISYINRTEDVPLGKHFFAKVGYGARAFDNQVPQWKFTGSYSDAPDVGEHHLLKFESYVDGGWLSDASDFENTVTGASVTYHYLVDDKNRWFARALLEAGHGLTEDKLLSVGGVADLRGYPTDFQRGDRRYVVNLERRYYSSLHVLNLVRLGTVVFLDAGQAWNSHTGLGIKPEYDAGFGLRLSSSKAHTGRVLHLDYAFPLQDQEHIAKAQWLLKVQESF